MVFKRRLKPVATADLIPMIDVIFQLVVFFMVSSTFIITPGIALELPDSATAEPVVMSRLAVTIVSENEIYLNKEKTDLEGLNRLIGALPEKSTETVKSVIVEGNRQVSYALMIQVLDILREHGFTGINLRMKEPGN